MFVLYVSPYLTITHHVQNTDTQMKTIVCMCLFLIKCNWSRLSLDRPHKLSKILLVLFTIGYIVKTKNRFHRFQSFDFSCI